MEFDEFDDTWGEDDEEGSEEESEEVEW